MLSVRSVPVLDRDAPTLPAIAGGLVGQRSRARIADFRLHRPESIAEALALKQRHPDAWFMAGGIDVANRLKTGTRVEDIIHLGRVAALAAIEGSPAGVWIGAGASHDAVARSPLLAASCPGLATAWSRIANPRVRFKGTVGGNVMADEPGYEALALLGAADATLCFSTSSGPKRLSAAELLARQNANAVDTAVLEGVCVPHAVSRPILYDRGLRGIAGIVLSARIAEGRILGARAAVTWAYRRPYVAPVAALDGAMADRMPEMAGDVAADWCRALGAPRVDHLASAAYRRRMVQVLLERAIAGLVQGTVA